MKVLMSVPVYGKGGTYERWQRMVDWPDALPFPEETSSHMIVFPNGPDNEQSVNVRSIEYHPEAELGHVAVIGCTSIRVEENETIEAYMAENHPGWERS